MGKQNPTLNVLCVDDSQNFADLIEDFLDEMEFRLGFNFNHVSVPEEAADYAFEIDADVILLDYRLGSMTGLEVLGILRDRGFEKPIIILTAEGNERVAVKSLRDGADDYIPKNDLTIDGLKEILESTLKEFLTEVKKEREQEEMSERLKKALSEESTTNLKNRRFFLERFDELFQDSHDQSYPLSLLIVRISSLDVYSAIHGPEVFDRISEITASTLRKDAGEESVVGRLKDEHFGVLWPDVPKSLAHKRSRGIITDLRQSYGELKEEKQLTVEFGGVVTDRQKSDTNYVSMLKRAVRELISIELDSKGTVELLE